MRFVIASIGLLIGVSSTAFAQAVPDIAASDVAFDYQTVTVGGSRDRAFAVSNGGTANLILFATEIWGADSLQFRIMGGGGGAILAPGAERLISVRFAPTADGLQQAVLRIESNDPDENPFEIRLSGTGRGIPDIALSRNSLPFGNVPIGSTSLLDVVITNQGSADLDITGTDLIGDDADQFAMVAGSAPFTVAPQGRDTITVRFAPSSGSAKNAVLRVSSNDPDESPLDIVLQGTGVGPAITADAAGHDFEEVPVGASAVHAFRISNIGTADLVVDSLKFLGTDAALFQVTQGGATPFVLAPGRNQQVTVQYAPMDRNAHSALLRFYTNDLITPQFDLVLRGRGETTRIAVDSTRHDFGEVIVGANAIHTFVISNAGQAPLIVDSLALQGSAPDQFQVIAGGAPFTVLPDQVRSLTVRFVPTADGPQSAILTLFSNDPDAPQLDLILEGTALAPALTVNAVSLDFGVLLAGLDATQTVLLINTGRARLTVARTLITGGDSTQFALVRGGGAFSVAPSDSLLLTVRFSPLSAGSKRSTLRLVSNDLVNPALDIALAGEARTFGVEAAQTAVPGEDLIVTVSLPPGFQPEAGTLFYRSVGETTYRATELTGTGPERQATIPGLVVQLSGIEYYVLIAAGSRAVTMPASQPQSRPLFVPARIDQLEAPISPQAWIYQMISVPLALDNQGVEAVLADDYGPYNTRRWRLFRWENGDNVEYPDIQGSFGEGKGFWLITNDGTPFDVENGQSTDPSVPFTVTLQPGWNQIGNPYAFPIPWPGGLLDPGVEAPASYDGMEFQYGATVLRPWEGYFVWNGSPSPVTVSLSVRASDAVAVSGSKARGERASAGDMPYRLRLFANVEGTPLRDTHNYLGFVDGAREGYDVLDFTEAPPIGDYVRLSIVEDGERYAGNFKPADETGQHWDLEVDGTFSRKSVRIRLAGAGRMPEDYALYVMDRDHRTAVAVVDSSFSIDLQEAFQTRRLRILIGTTHYVEANRDGIPLVPASFRLEQNYPNPFNPETTIRYQLSDQSLVHLDIYNLMGQRVHTLVQATQEAGSYVTRWDGHNEEGVPVASGIYVYRLRAGAFTATRKMLLLR